MNNFELFLFLKINLKHFLKCNPLGNEMNSTLTDREVGNIVYKFHFSNNSVFEFIASNIPLNSCNHLLRMQFVGNINNKNSQSSLIYRHSNFFLHCTQFNKIIIRKAAL